MPKENKQKRVRYRDAFTGAIRLGSRDIGLDPETGSVMMDSGPVVPHRDDFRFIGEQLSDGDLDLLDLTAFAQNYEYHPERFVRYE